MIWQIAFGFQMSACNLVGTQVGANDASAARNMYRSVFNLSMIINLIEFSCLTYIRLSIVTLFTSSEIIIKKTNDNISYLIIVMFLDFV